MTHLLLGEFECVEFVEEAECGGDDAPRGHPPHPPTHARAAAARSLTGAHRPGLQVINLVVNLVHNLVKCPHLKQLGLIKNKLLVARLTWIIDFTYLKIR